MDIKITHTNLTMVLQPCHQSTWSSEAERGVKANLMGPGKSHLRKEVVGDLSHSTCLPWARTYVQFPATQNKELGSKQNSCTSLFSASIHLTDWLLWFFSYPGAVFISEVCFQERTDRWILLFICSVCLCLFIGEMRPFTPRLLLGGLY